MRFVWMPLVFALVFVCVVLVKAPKGTPTLTASASSWFTQRQTAHDGGSSSFTQMAMAGAAAAAAAAAASAIMAQNDQPEHSPSPSHGKMAAKGSGMDADSPIRNDDWDCSEIQSDEEDFDEDGEDDDDDGSSHAVAAPPQPRKSTGKLWGTQQFPEGTNGPSNYDLDILNAAQNWDCPCPDRRNCIGAERLSVLDLFEHRKKFRTTAHGRGGYRDACRCNLQAHYDKQTQFCGWRAWRLLRCIGWPRDGGLL